MTDRSSRPDVRNPIAALPAFQGVQALSRDAKKAIKAVYYALAEDCAVRAEKAWATSKGPMALYYKTRSVECRHIARGIKL